MVSIFSSTQGAMLLKSGSILLIQAIAKITYCIAPV